MIPPWSPVLSSVKLCLKGKSGYNEEESRRRNAKGKRGKKGDVHGGGEFLVERVEARENDRIH